MVSVPRPAETWHHPAWPWLPPDGARFPPCRPRIPVSFFQGGPGFLQGLLPFRQGFAFLVKGWPCRCPLGLTGFQLASAAANWASISRLLAVQFRKSGVYLVHGVGKLALSRFQFGFLSLHGPFVPQFFQLGGIGLLLGFQLIQLGLIFVCLAFKSSSFCCNDAMVSALTPFSTAWSSAA